MKSNVQFKYASRLVCTHTQVVWKRSGCVLIGACALIKTNMVVMKTISIIQYPSTIIEQVCEETNNLGFRPGPTQTGLYGHRRWLEA